MAALYSGDGEEAKRAEAIARAKEATVQLPDNQAVVALITMAALSGDCGDTKSALELHTSSIERAPAVALAWFNYGVTLHRIGTWDAVSTCYTKALAIHAGLANAHLYRGLVHAARGDVDNARRDWNDAVSREFEEKYLTVFDPEILATLEKLGQLSQMFTSVEQECSQ